MSNTMGVSQNESFFFHFMIDPMFCWVEPWIEAGPEHWFFDSTQNDLYKSTQNIPQNKWLVGGFKHDFYFPFHIWDVILSIDFHIFQRGGSTTNQNHTFYSFLCFVLAGVFVSVADVRFSVFVLSGFGPGVFSVLSRCRLEGADSQPAGLSPQLGVSAMTQAIWNTKEIPRLIA